MLDTFNITLSLRVEGVIYDRHRVKMSFKVGTRGGVGALSITVKL